MESAGRRFTDGVSIGVLTRIFHRDLVDEVLVATGRLEQWSRLLPARVVVYYMLALCLFFEDSYEEVMRKLVNGLRFLGTWRDDWHVPTDGAISQARSRLGEQPMKVLFEQVAQPLAVPGTKGAWFHGWRVMAVDGVILDVPDTAKNRDEFGKIRHHKGGESPFPQVRVVGVGECGTHAIIAAAFDSWRVQERALFNRLLDDLEPGMLVLADRGFYSYDQWVTVRDTGVEMTWRVKEDMNLPVLEWLSDGSYRSELIPAELKADLKKGLRQSIPDDVRIPVRVVEYMVTNRKGGERETIRLITSIMDHELAPAIELAALYHDRWEFELTLDEIETHQMPWSRLLRSKTPDLVRQEIWSLLLAHYAVRHLMHEAADDLGEDPERMSFIRSLRVVRRQVTNQAGFSPSPTRPRSPRNDGRNTRTPEPGTPQP